MTETRSGIIKSLSTNSLGNLKACSKCIACRDHDTNTCSKTIKTVFKEDIPLKKDLLKIGNMFKEDRIEQHRDPARNSHEVPRSPIQAWAQSHKVSNHTTRFIKQSGHSATSQTHKHRVPIPSVTACYSSSDSGCCDTCPSSSGISPTRQSSVDGCGRQGIEYAVEYKSITYKSYSKSVIGDVAKHLTPNDHCQNASGEHSSFDLSHISRQEVPSNLCQKKISSESSPLQQCVTKKITSCKYKNISSNNKINNPVLVKSSIKKCTVANKKRKSPIIIECQSVESTHSSEGEEPPSLFYNLPSELPSTSKFLPFFTPHNDLSQTDIRSAEFFTPCGDSPILVNQTNEKDFDPFANLLDLPSSLANLDVPLLDEEDISYCKKENGAVISIGQGVYGGVYLAALRGNPSKVVIKDFEASTSSEKHIVNEAKILRHLQSTGFVPEFLGIARAAPQKQLALIQEFFGNGVTLGKLLNGNRVPSLSYRSWICILFQMATGIYHIHSKGVLHNDIQTGNILVDVEHPFHKTKFIDFGLATFRCGHKFGSNRDYLLQFEHLAPEVQNGQRSSFKSDVFSLGWVMGTIAQTTEIDNDIIWDAIEEMTNEDPDERPFTDTLCSVFKQPLLQELNK